MSFKASDVIKYINPKGFMLNVIDSIIRELDTSRMELRRVVKEITEIINSDNFVLDDTNSARVRGKLVELSFYLDSLVSKLIEFESLYSSFSVGSVETPGVEEKGGLKSKLSRVLKRAKVVVQPSRPPKSPTIEYGRRILQYVKDIINSFPSCKVLVSEQDTPTDRGREVFMVEMYRTSIYNLLSDVISFSNAVVREEKRRYIEYVKAIAESQSEVKIKAIGEGKK